MHAHVQRFAAALSSAVAVRVTDPVFEGTGGSAANTTPATPPSLDGNSAMRGGRSGQAWLDGRSQEEWARFLAGSKVGG